MFYVLAKNKLIQESLCHHGIMFYGLVIWELMTQLNGKDSLDMGHIYVICVLILA